jgi:DNA-binding PadR family transcriptional regulator
MQGSAQPPLSHGEFYLLQVLSLGEGHAYSLRGRVASLSLRAINPSSGTFSPLLTRLHDQGYIDILGNKPAGKSGAQRRHYGISELGVLRLKEELVRLRHAVKTAENAGLFADEIPLDIQKLLLEAR